MLVPWTSWTSHHQRLGLPVLCHFFPWVSQYRNPEHWVLHGDRMRSVIEILDRSIINMPPKNFIYITKDHLAQKWHRFCFAMPKPIVNPLTSLAHLWDEDEWVRGLVREHHTLLCDKKPTFHATVKSCGEYADAILPVLKLTKETLCC